METGCGVVRSVEVTAGSTKIKLVYGAEPRVGNKTIGGDSVYVFDGGVMANTGIMITISLDVGVEVTWDTSLSLLRTPLFDSSFSLQVLSLS